MGHESVFGSASAAGESVPVKYQAALAYAQSWIRNEAVGPHGLSRENTHSDSRMIVLPSNASEVDATSGMVPGVEITVEIVAFDFGTGTVARRPISRTGLLVSGSICEAREGGS